MMQRRDFLAKISILSAGAFWPGNKFSIDDESSFAKQLKPVSRALEMEGYYVRCNTPIRGDDGKIHVFFSRWPEKRGMGGWINADQGARYMTASSFIFKIV